MSTTVGRAARHTLDYIESCLDRLPYRISRVRTIDWFRYGLQNAQIADLTEKTIRLAFITGDLVTRSI